VPASCPSERSVWFLCPSRFGSARVSCPRLRFWLQVRDKTDSCHDTTTKCFGPVTGAQLSGRQRHAPIFHRALARAVRPCSLEANARSSRQPQLGHTELCNAHSGSYPRYGGRHRAFHGGATRAGAHRLTLPDGRMAVAVMPDTATIQGCGLCSDGCRCEWRRRRHHRSVRQAAALQSASTLRRSYPPSLRA
jgi:hypothetical protein